MRTYLAAACIFGAAVAAPDIELVTSMPGMPFDTNVYSGYIKLKGSKNIHYIFVES